MKKLVLKPGFEFIFALSLIVILGLPPMLMAQTNKDLEIKIENGDTTINGKNIKALSVKDRQEALQDINHISSSESSGPGDKSGRSRREFLFKRMDTTGGKPDRWGGPGRGDHPPMIAGSRDSLGNIVEGKRPGKFRDMGPLKDRMHDGAADNVGFKDRSFNRPFMGAGHRFDHKNSQNFDYMNTDKDGISTHVTYHVSEASNDDLKRMPHVEGPKFEINDLNLAPQFTKGKTFLMFSLPSKAVADIKLHDSEGNLLWSEKATGGNFSKAFSLGLNGIYYLQIKQGNNVAVKRIMKEE